MSDKDYIEITWEIEEDYHSSRVHVTCILIEDFEHCNSTDDIIKEIEVRVDKYFRESISCSYCREFISWSYCCNIGDIAKDIMARVEEVRNE